MSSWREKVRLTALAADMEQAHRFATGAAAAGLRDAGLGALRLAGDCVPVLAEAAVSSATPFVRAPLLSRLSRVRLLHPAAGGSEECPSCSVPSPCPTARELDL